MSQLVHAAASPTLPALVAASGERAGVRFLEFFAATIRNPHTRRAYGRAVAEFLAWCARAGVPSLAAVQPLHVATWVEAQTRELAAPSVKQRLAAVRHLFDWLVTGQVVPTNPAASVRGPGPQRARRQDAGARPGRGAPAARQHRRDHPGGPARPGAERPYGPQLRPRRRGARHA